MIVSTSSLRIFALTTLGMLAAACGSSGGAAVGNGTDAGDDGASGAAGSSSGGSSNGSGGNGGDGGSGAVDGGAGDAGADAALDASGDGSTDPCAADADDAADKVECNGAVPGARDPGEEGGLCDETADCSGDLECVKLGSEQGVCLAECEPADTYSSTGGCSTGFRCITLDDDDALCLPDCNENSDCAADSCFPEKVCGFPAPPPVDGGAEAGAADAGGDAAPPTVIITREISFREIRTRDVPTIRL